VLSPSLALVVLVVITGVVAVAALVFAFVRGWLEDDALASQATIIFDAEELRLERPWESPAQKAERAQTHGAAVVPPPGSFGGAR
jgi:hypothetical protein